MADYITKIRTIDGDKQIDYNALANLPDLSLVGEVKILNSSENVEAKIIILTDKNDNPIAPTTDASAVYIDGIDTVKNVLNKIMGVVTNNGIILRSDVDYGIELPSDASVGQLFFKKVT